MAKITMKELFGVHEPIFDPSCKLVTSPFFSPTVLAIIRLLVALYSTTTMIIGLAADGVFAGRDFSYFTNLTYIGIIAYYWASSVQTISYSLRKREEGTGYPLQTWPKVLQSLHLILQATVVTYPIIVTAVFWALLSGPETLGTPFEAWHNISVHALNTVFCVFEMLFTHSPRPRWLFLLFTFLTLAGYLGLAYVTKETQGFYTYPFLDPSKGPILAVYIIGIALANVVVFSVVWGLMTLRTRLFPVKIEIAADDIRLEKGSMSKESV